jgi:glycosyltransferase involved in cell wall biosynthesis
VSDGGILQVIASTDRRGAEVFALDLEAALLRRGRATRTVALAPGRQGGLSVPTLGRRPLAPGTLRALRRAARDATVVIAHGSTTLPACALALAGTGVPFVYRNIGDPTFWASTPLRRARVRCFLGRAELVVAIAPGAASELTHRFGVERERVTTIPTGVPAARHQPADARARRAARVALGLPPDAPVVAVVAALSPEKNVGPAIDTIGECPDVVLVVAGDGPERPTLEAHARAAAPGRVHFTGSIGDPAPVYAAADALLLTSRTEGLPAVLIEAGLSGLPAIATDVGYVREVVVDGETGVIVPPGDVGAAARAVGHALARRDALGGAARARCLDRFELEHVAAQWDEVLGSCRRRRST